MDIIFLVFPNQLFKNTELFRKINVKKIYLLEDTLFFGDYIYPLKFHKFKLILHRASMKFYESYLKKQSFNVEYCEYSILFRKKLNFYIEIFFQKNIHTYDPVDYILEKRLKKAANIASTEIIFHHNPCFINTKNDNLNYSKNSVGKVFFHTNFYIYQRKRLNILIDDTGKPIGGKWSFDIENRKKIPKNLEIPNTNLPIKNDFVKEAEIYINTHFQSNPPYILLDTDDILHTSFYPTTFEEAKKILIDFLIYKLELFGSYQDAITTHSDFVFHSVLSSSINIGLLTPGEVLDSVMNFYDNSKHKETILNSIEGFVRQIIGWREFMRFVYEEKGVELRNSNFFGHINKLPNFFYTCETNNEVLKYVLTKVSKLAYLHHIERLMIIGNYLLLSQIDPNEGYKWFMEMFIDAYDWVMVPNLYGMSQYSDGGSIVTKPYISSSKYILKMGFYQGNWQNEWDDLFWTFIKNKYDILKSNPRMQILCNLLEKKIKNINNSTNSINKFNKY
ncbi:MAG: cryptochrome/photolyase family protein [Candidatus Dojkabacteria bacterium]|nr:cryptochrome/photolyase family protein [Candidatus Dojkabacteria bacterium]